MQLRDLPAEILTGVLRRSLSDRYYVDERWFRLNLQLVAVCRRLRYIALPLVYREVRVEAYDENSTWRDKFNVDWSRGEFGRSAGNSYRSHGRWRAVSNVDLIASMGHIGLVQHMR
ncbi:hypothetical protein H4R19_006970, partial [Coemansia spiralis]